MTNSLTHFIRKALHEDCPVEDLTTALLVDKTQKGTSRIVVKSSGIFYGEQVLSVIGDSFLATGTVTMEVSDGDLVEEGVTVATLSGPLHQLLKVERVMLNLLQRLSGVATTTRAFVDALDDSSIKILDTRKTTPLCRFLEREAVLAGGGAIIVTVCRIWCW